MLKRLTRFSHSIALLPLTTALLTASAVAGCDGEGRDGPEIAEDSAKNVRISADTLAKLSGDERLSIDMSASGVMYYISFAQPLDFGRIDLSFPAGKASMDSALESVFTSPYSPLKATSQQFVITADPTSFPQLTDADIDALRTERMIMREHGSSTPNAQPQSIGDCVEQTLYFFVDVTIDGVVVSLPCSHTILVCGGEQTCTKQAFGGHDYLFCEDAESWNTAKANCASAGSGLLTLDSSTEENWVYHVANGISTQKWWTGLNDSASEGRFVWDSGQPVTYTNWYAGEPNDAGYNEDCGQLNRFYPEQGWNDEPCGLHLRYICESN